MVSQAKTCKNCQTSFSVDHDDQQFYGVLGVPSPTHCPQCRMQRRLAFRNERTLYKRGCDLCKQSIVSAYPIDAPFPVYCTKCWWSDGWDAMEYGRPYDSSKSFFQQFRELADTVPHLGIPNTSNNFDSPYTSWMDWAKNCYLVFGSTKVEDSLYGELLYDCRDSMDLTNCNETERSYNCVNSKKCYGCVWSINCVSCNDCYFTFDCRGSNHCFLSYNLRNRSYYFLNEQLTKEEWHRRVDEVLGSHEKMQRAFETFKNLMRQSALHRYANFVQTVESTGNDLLQTKNAKMCFDSSKLEDCRYVTYGDDIRDCQDVYAVVEGTQRSYELLSVNGAANSAFLMGCWEGNIDIQLSNFVVDSKNVIGSHSLRKKQNCILNRQYTAEEYNEIATRIKREMTEHEEYGEYFPIASSDFAYNETLAQDYHPLTKDEALKRGYRWRDDIGGTYGKETMTVDQIPDSIADTPRSITEEVLACTKCTKNYRIIDREFDFYVKMKLPIPRLCTDCRYRLRLEFRNLRKLWNRECQCAGASSKNGKYANTAVHSSHEQTQSCPVTFETTYADTREEIVYGDSCYQAEVV